MANQYLVKPGTDFQFPVSGQFLARNKHNHAERAFFGADLVTGRWCLFDPTVLQAAVLARVSPSSVRAALRQEEVNRYDIECGLLPLQHPRNGNGHVKALAKSPTIDDATVADVVGPTSLAK
jgi:hypothetical protein